MKFWATLGLGAVAGAGVSMALRHQTAPSVDDGVLEARIDDGVETVATLEDPPVNPASRERIEALGAAAGMSPDQVQFLVFVAFKESRFRPNVGRGDPRLQPPGMHRFAVDLAEADAARRAYERNAKRLADCGHEPASYSFGSGGLFAFLPTYPLVHLRHTPLRCAHPYDVFDPAFSMTAAYSFARGLSRSRFFDGTVRALRAGWGSLANMKDPQRHADKLPRWRRHLRAVGVDESWLHEGAPAWPKRDLMTMYRAMDGRLATEVT